MTQNQVAESANSADIRVNLATPIRSERVRFGFQPHWRTVFVYRCSLGHETRILASAFSGRRAVPGVGAVYCSHCISR